MLNLRGGGWKCVIGRCGCQNNEINRTGIHARSIKRTFCSLCGKAGGGLPLARNITLANCAALNNPLIAGIDPRS